MKPIDRVNAAQKQAAEPGSSIWVSANAGSGKTKVLIDRVARLLLEKVPPDTIICITFTKAAASEMQQRLFKRLGEWSVLGDKALQKELNDLQGGSDGYDYEQLKSARALFAKALETPGGLRIETLHAFAGRVLRRFPLEAGVPPGFTELDDIANADLWRRASRRTFERLMARPDGPPAFARLMTEIKGRRYEGAINLIQGNATRLRRFISRFPSHDDQYAILSDRLGAPRKSHDALLDDLVGSGLPTDRLQDAVEVLSSATKKGDKDLHGFLVESLNAPTTEAALAHYRRVFQTGKHEPRGRNAYTKDFEGTLIERLFSLSDGSETLRFNTLITQIAAAQIRDRTLTLLDIAAPMLEIHTHEKRLRTGLDFDDLILETRNLLTEAGLAEWVLYKLDGGVSHVLLDEAQDTSPDQWVIVNALVEEFFSGATANDLIRTLFVVGDEKQSIYSFQGADTAKFQRERQLFSARETNPDFTGGAIHLPEVEMSFRSTPHVLTFVDEVFNGPATYSGAPFSTEIPTGADEIHHPAFRENDKGQVEFWPLEQPDEKQTNVPWDAPIDMERHTSPQAMLAEKIANWIRDRLAPGAPGVYPEGRDKPPVPADPGDILILVRSRNALFHSIIRELKRQGLPVAGADRLNILDTLAVQDVLNMVRFALLPEDDLTLAEILKGPYIGLLDDDEGLFPLAYGRKKESLWSRLQASDQPDHQRAVSPLTDVLARRTSSAFEFLTWLMSSLHPTTGQTGWQMIHARFGTPARDPLDALISLSLSIDDAESASLQTFLAAVETQNSEIKREQSAPSGEIRVMTVHGSKGLEAPIVILPDTTEFKKPTLSGSLIFDEDGLPIWLGDKSLATPETDALMEIETAKARAESHRLLYVALTRARDHLLVCGAWRGRSDGKGYQDGSWFDLCQQTTEAWSLPGAQSFEDGRWQYGTLPLPQAGEAAPATSAKPPLPDWISRPVTPHATERQDELRAPSQLLPGDTPVIPPFGRDHIRRFQRGRLIHALLEILPDVPRESREERARAFLNRCLDEENAHQRDDILETAFRVLNDPELSEVFGPGGRAEAPIVGSGPNLPKGVLINGRIDRMRVTETHVWVIDYKTDRPPPKSQEDVAPPYLAQLGSYHDVLSVTYPDKIVKCALLWTDGPHFMVLDESVMLNALKKAQGEN